MDTTSNQTGNQISKRAIIFIDGNNFYHGMKSIGLPSGVELDYATFSEKLVYGRKLLETRYYIGRVQQQGDLTRYQTQRKFLSHLSKFPQVSAFLGRLESRPVTNNNKKLKRWLKALPNRKDVSLPQHIINELEEIAQSANPLSWVEKAVDVMIATDIVSMAYENQYDVAYLVSADGDFTPAVKKVRETGRQVFVASPVSGYQLAQVANTFIPLKREFFHGCWR